MPDRRFSPRKIVGGEYDDDDDDEDDDEDVVPAAAAEKEPPLSPLLLFHTQAGTEPTRLLPVKSA